MKTDLRDAILIIGFALLTSLFMIGVANSQTLATVPVMGQGSHDAHDYSFGPIIVPVKATLVRVVFDSSDRLQGDQTLTAVVLRSLVGGLPDEPAGGQIFDSINQPATFVLPLPQPNSIARVIGGRLTLYGGRWRGKAFVEIE